MEIDWGLVLRVLSVCCAIGVVVMGILGFSQHLLSDFPAGFIVNTHLVFVISISPPHNKQKSKIEIKSVLFVFVFLFVFCSFIATRKQSKNKIKQKKKTNGRVFSVLIILGELRLRALLTYFEFLQTFFGPGIFYILFVVSSILFCLFVLFVCLSVCESSVFLWFQDFCFFVTKDSLFFLR